MSNVYKTITSAKETASTKKSDELCEIVIHQFAEIIEAQKEELATLREATMEMCHREIMYRDYISWYEGNIAEERAARQRVEEENWRMYRVLSELLSNENLSEEDREEIERIVLRVDI